MRKKRTSRKPLLGRKRRFEQLESRKLFAVVTGDFNGDGLDDIVESNPMASVSGQAEAGEVRVMYADGYWSPSDKTFNQNSSGVQGSAEWGDHYGHSLAVGDFDGDGYDDLAIGIPDEDLGWVPDAGAVNILYGASWGLSALRSDFITQDDIANIGVEAYDRFGEVLDAGDYDGDGRSDLAVGVPSEDIGNVVDAGMAVVLYSDLFGVNPRYEEILHQGVLGVGAAVESHDRFGSSLASGNFYGDGYDSLAVGVPMEDLGWKQDAGAVHVFEGTPSGLIDPWGRTYAASFTQDSHNVPGVAETGDHFGFSLAVGDFDGNGVDDLAIGAPGEAVGNIIGAGAVNVLYGDVTSRHFVFQPPWSRAVRPTFLPFYFGANQMWHQDVYGIMGEAERHDFFGAHLAVRDVDGDGVDDLMIFVPGEDGFPSNFVHTIRGYSGWGLHWWQNTAIA